MNRIYRMLPRDEQRGTVGGLSPDRMNRIYRMFPNRESPGQNPVHPVILSRFRGPSSCAQQGGTAVLRVGSMEAWDCPSRCTRKDAELNIWREDLSVGEAAGSLRLPCRSLG